MKLIETPRDAWQGINKIVPTAVKAQYLNTLLKVGFDIVEFGSFVSPKAIPQLADTAKLLKLLNINSSSSNLMVLIGNKRGGETALQLPEIKYISYPFSISPTFLKKNLNTTIKESIQFIAEFSKKALKNNQELITYITMAFGNPYNDNWDIDIIRNCVADLNKIGIRKITFTDIVGISTPKKIKNVFTAVIPEYSQIEFGFHLHTTINTWYNKIDAAYKSGCRSFDSVINGYGGCPFTGKELLGNINTINMLSYCTKNNIKLPKIDTKQFSIAINKATEVFEY